MAPKLSKTFGSASPHTSGIYSDMTVDGPEIGTLVVVVDRAKNLPNLRTMGKQDPYCSLRLGKDAKKTETDRRGGQTPRWDQELRFTVHDSLDYHKIKVSIFNDDRKTDLIGESFISLDDILQIGGGQEDGWHDLHCKGRYAGQVRLEFTFYDTRPAAVQDEFAVGPQHAMNAPDLDSRAIGPRQQAAPKRRPVPSSRSSLAQQGNAATTPNSVPVPQVIPRSFHTPPNGDTPSPYYEDHSEHQQYQGAAAYYSPPGQSYASTSARSLPDHTISTRQLPSNSPPGFYGQFGRAPQQGASAYDHDRYFDARQLDTNDFYDETQDIPDEQSLVYSDDPHALEATEHYRFGEQVDPVPAPLRHERVQTLSYGRSPPRSLQQKPGLPHANSAPILTHEQMQNYSPHGQSSFAKYMDNSYDRRGNGVERPPPPPTHRNSAPFPGEHLRRPLPTPQSRQPMGPIQVATGSQSSPMASWAPRHSTEPVQRRRSGGASNAYQTHSSGYGPPHNGTTVGDSSGHTLYPRSSMGSLPTMYNAVSHDAPVYTTHQRPGPTVMQNVTGPTDARDGPLLRPRAISPTRMPHANSSPITPGIARKSINAQSTPNHSSPSIPFSPDSYEAYNPRSSVPTTPSTAGNREPSPMYSSQSPAIHTQSPLAQQSSTTREAPSIKPSPPVPAIGNYHLDPHSPIMNAKGRLVDPTDHLPTSTYAPEPEAKPGDRQRASVTATVTSRFGPREARPTPVSTRSLPTTPLQPSEDKSGTARFQQKRLPNGSSPLAPSPPHALNAGYGNSQAPPPVPGKIPFDAESYDEDDMRGLYSGFEQLHTYPAAAGGIGRSPLQRIEAVGGDERYGGGRGRRSKYGA
ncbi:MAG: hypothetical protein M1828_001406 [Chrysothrix sp. TS-e1954]|nr:MAG: hypothetical protein M1828_001406 [Chrysothrix sp. TS-e1954]